MFMRLKYVTRPIKHMVREMSHRIAMTAMTACKRLVKDLSSFVERNQVTGYGSYLPLVWIVSNREARHEVLGDKHQLKSSP